jgi:hypothetical protein
VRVCALSVQLPKSRGVTGFTDSYVACGQTEPPSIPVANLFEAGTFPVGEIMEQPGDFNTFRITSEEKRAQERWVGGWVRTTWSPVSSMSISPPRKKVT